MWGACTCAVARRAAAGSALASRRIGGISASSGVAASSGGGPLLLSAGHRAICTSATLLQKKGKPAAGGAAGPAFTESFDVTKQIPVNLLKEGEDPVYQSDDKYPPWLFKLLDEKPILEDFIMAGMDKVAPADRKMVLRMANKRRIKSANEDRRKK